MLNSSLTLTSVYLWGSSSRLCLASSLWWPHGDLLLMRSGGKRVGMKSKYLRWGFTLVVRVQAGAPVCLGSVCTVSTDDDQPWISVVLHQPWHLPGICNAMSCTCCALWPDPSRHCKTLRVFSSHTVSECKFSLSGGLTELAVIFSLLLTSYLKLFIYHNYIWQVRHLCVHFDLGKNIRCYSIIAWEGIFYRACNPAT